ncbi:MAG: Fic family protein [Clostridia bacterium]|nr:Fic family protein [Clostridia bacterium]
MLTEERKNYVFNVDESIFNLVEASEIIENFEYNEDNVSVLNGGDTFKEISNEIVSEFLRCPETKAYIIRNQDGTFLEVHNFVSHETIRIANLGDHLLAQNEVLLASERTKKRMEKNPETAIVSHKMIQDINQMLFSNRIGEVGIGEYRDVDYIGRPVHVVVGSFKDGEYHMLPDWQPIKGGNKNVKKNMDELVNWTNSEEFRKTEPVLRAAKFHARFIEIHPFRDGNGRTGRMLLNYMLAISGKKLTNIRGDAKQDYYAAITSAVVNHDYAPLVKVIKDNPINNSRELYHAIFKYSNEREKNIDMPLKIDVVNRRTKPKASASEDVSTR